MTQTNRSTKIDLPRPNPQVLYCIRKIENRPELGYCYLTVLVALGMGEALGEMGSRMTPYCFTPMLL